MDARSGVIPAVDDSDSDDNVNMSGIGLLTHDLIDYASKFLAAYPLRIWWICQRRHYQLLLSTHKSIRITSQSYSGIRQSILTECHSVRYRSKGSTQIIDFGIFTNLRYLNLHKAGLMLSHLEFPHLQSLDIYKGFILDGDWSKFPQLTSLSCKLVKDMPRDFPTQLVELRAVLPRRRCIIPDVDLRQYSRLTRLLWHDSRRTSTPRYRVFYPLSLQVLDAQSVTHLNLLTNLVNLRVDFHDSRELSELSRLTHLDAWGVDLDMLEADTPLNNLRSLRCYHYIEDQLPSNLERLSAYSIGTQLTLAGLTSVTVMYWSKFILDLTTLNELTVTYSDGRESYSGLSRLTKLRILTDTDDYPQSLISLRIGRMRHYNKDLTDLTNLIDLTVHSAHYDRLVSLGLPPQLRRLNLRYICRKRPPRSSAEITVSPLTKLIELSLMMPLFDVTWLTKLTQLERLELYNKKDFRHLPPWLRNIAV